MEARALHPGLAISCSCAWVQADLDDFERQRASWMLLDAERFERRW